MTITRGRGRYGDGDKDALSACVVSDIGRVGACVVSGEQEQQATATGTVLRHPVTIASKGSKGIFGYNTLYSNLQYCEISG